MLTDVNPGVVVHMFDKADMECEYTSPPSEASGLNTSAVGPGLDSDFGASAGTLPVSFSLMKSRWEQFLLVLWKTQEMTADILSCNI